MPFDLSELNWATVAPYAVRLVRIAMILGAALVVCRVVCTLISRSRVRLVEMMAMHAEDGKEALEKRAATISGLLRTTSVVIVWVVAVVMSLREAGFDIAPLLAGAGIAGVAIGFGAQTLVKDVISGVFMLLENQVRVGDVVQLNGVGGLVEEVNLRTTVLRSLDGTVHIFPNGSIQQVSNLTREFSYYVFEMGVAYKEDTDRVSQLMRETTDELRETEDYGPKILEPLEVLGVDKFADSAVVIKARIKTKPSQQWAVGRELNRRFKKRFDELGIEIPFPHVSVYFGEASKPFLLNRGEISPGENPNAELKQIVREVLVELKANEGSREGGGEKDAD